MAPTFSNANRLSAVVADNIYLAINRRCYAAAAEGVKSSAAKQLPEPVEGVVMPKKQGGEEMAGTVWTSPWVPDPATGYYRPENLADEKDVADLRKILLKNHR